LGVDGGMETLLACGERGKRGGCKKISNTCCNIIFTHKRKEWKGGVKGGWLSQKRSRINNELSGDHLTQKGGKRRGKTSAYPEGLGPGADAMKTRERVKFSRNLTRIDKQKKEGKLNGDVQSD